MPPTIRLAAPDDAAAVLAIYAPVVRDTAVSFEAEPPTVEAMAGRRAVSSSVRSNPPRLP